MKKLTDAQFNQVQDAIDDAMRSAKRGTLGRVAILAKAIEWEEANNLPQATASQREVRYAALYEAARTWIKL